MRLVLSSSLLLLVLGQAAASALLRSRQDSGNSTSENGSDSGEPEKPPIGFVLIGDTVTGALVPPDSDADEDAKATSSGWSAGFCAALSNVPAELCLSFAPSGPAPADNTNPEPSDDGNDGGGSGGSGDAGEPSDESSPARLLRRQENNSTDPESWKPVLAATALTDPTLYPAALAAIKDMRAQGVSPVYVTLSFGNDDERAGTRLEDVAGTVKTMIQGVKEAGGEPILVTTMTRRSFGDAGLVHDGLRPYVTATLNVAREEKVTAVDFHWASVRLCSDIGPDYCNYFSLTPEDDTYLNNDGSALLGRLAAELVKSSEPLGVIGLEANWELRSQIARYISMGHVDKPKDDSGASLSAGVLALLVGLFCSVSGMLF